MTKKLLFAIVAVIAFAFTVSSCIKGESGPAENYIQDYFTVDGINPTYTLYSDHGYTVYLSSESVAQLPGGKGFDGHKRVNLLLSYTDDNVTQSEKTAVIRNAVIQSGQYMDEKDPMTVELATEKKQLEEDSLFIVETLFYTTQYGAKIVPWVGAKQYLNVPCYAGYAYNGKGIYPTFNLAYDPATFKENEAEVTFLYNRHCAKTLGSVYYQAFETTFPMANIIRQVPGNDSVVVTINAKGKEPVKLKVGRY